MAHDDFNSLNEVHRVQRCPKHVLFDERVSPCDDDIWSRIKQHYKPHKVFVNIPYESSYRPFAAAIIATLLKVGLEPQLALFRSEGKHRLCKICELMQSSKYCITDLSIERLHNMPFELGYCAALGRLVHTFVLINERWARIGTKEVRKFTAQISNLQGVVEPITYDNDTNKLVKELLKRMQGGGIPEATFALEEKRQAIADEIMKLARLIEPALSEGTADEFVAAWLRGGFTPYEEL
jgi:hypothetical protein